MLDLPRARQVATCDYHVHRRPGEVMIIRWLAGEQVETFYERFQDHFDVALSTYRQEERSANEWRQDPPTLAYLDELDKVQQRMSDWYLRDVLRRHGLFAISTTTADEIDILHLCNHLMGVPASRLVGAASAPPEDEPTEQERAWFFKLFSLRGMTGGAERMCFFAFLQKTGEAWD